MVLLNRSVLLVNEVTDVMKEKGWSLELDEKAISDACDGITDWQEKEKARQKAIRAEIKRFRANQDAAEAILRKRKASMPPSTVTKFCTDTDLRKVLDGIELDPQVHDIPGLSFFRLRLSSARHPPDLQGTSVAGADHNILVFYVGPYRPGFPAPGFYLVYDAWANSLSAIHQLPYLGGGSIGSEVAVLRHAPPSDYILAELLLTGELPRASLWTWCSSGPSARQWIHKPVILPPEVCTPTYIFHADTTFSLGKFALCWVDLLVGILMTCDTLAPEPVFQFIPLPEGCYMEPPDPQDGRQVPQEYRSMCCGNDGIIRFISIDGYHQDLSINDMKNMFLRTWSLTLSPKEWKQEAALCIGDLWCDTTHQKLPALMPTWPVHSILHADVVFLYLSGPNTGNNTGETERYMVSINVQHREAISISKLSPDDSSPPPRYFPSSFNSYINKDCLALAISLTTPMDACRCCAVSRAFQKAANSDSVWRHFLPKDYLSILARADDRVHFTSEKKLLVSLVKDHVLLDQHSKSLWLERTSLAKCYLLSSRSLAIAWEDHPLKWRWISLPDSRFEEVAELLKVCWLDLCGRVNCRELSPNTEYAAYLVFKLTDDSYGLDCQTQEADITMDDQVVSAKRTISFYPRPRPSTRETLSNMCRIEEAGQAEEPSYPRERGDGWLEVQLGHFYNDLEDTGVVVIRLKEHIQLNWKRGLILEDLAAKTEEYDEAKIS
uniref:DUF1618 domain-containing protein n=1 Tax=Oryza barthii TaxID=65489 RepID=A0A0D3HQX1_9ORYZ